MPNGLSTIRRGIGFGGLSTISRGVLSPLDLINLEAICAPKIFLISSDPECMVLDSSPLFALDAIEPLAMVIDANPGVQIADIIPEISAEDCC